MSEASQNQDRVEETDILHLNKFVPAVNPETNAAPPASDDGTTAFIAKAAAQTARQSEKPVVLPEDAGPLPAESMLGIVSYCYTKGVYSSADIEREMMQDPKLRAACDNQVPRPEAIRRFRRLNREAIQATLEKVFKSARKKIAEAWSPSNPFRASSSTTSTPAPARANDTGTIAKRQAADVLNKATFIDGMSM